MKPSKKMKRRNVAHSEPSAARGNPATPIVYLFFALVLFGIGVLLFLNTGSVILFLAALIVAAVLVAIPFRRGALGRDAAELDVMVAGPSEKLEKEHGLGPGIAYRSEVVRLARSVHGGPPYRLDLAPENIYAESLTEPPPQQSEPTEQDQPSP
jgi:hypothetical protein